MPGDEPTSPLDGQDSTTIPSPAAEPGAAPPAPGLGTQAKATRAAGLRFVRAHIDLAKAEFGEIFDRVKAAGAKIGVAIALAIFLGMLLPVGGTLFVGEWLFGSIGWGLLHGTLFAIALIVVMALSALEVPGGRLAGAFFGALLLGIVAAVVLAPALPNHAYAALGDSAFPGIESGVRPLLVGMALLALVGAVLGLLGGIIGMRCFGGAIGLFVVFGILGALVGAVSAVSFEPRVGIALGIAVLLAVWPMLAATNLRGFDWEALKNSYIPHATIDTTKESMEWVRGLTQRSKKS